MSSTPIEDEQAAGVVPRGREKSADAPAASESAWSEQLRATVDARLALIMENREKLVRAFIAETGLLPSQCELVETHTGFSTVVRVRRRGEP